MRDVLHDGIQERVGVPQGLLRPLPLRDVTRHLREALEAPGVVTDGANDNVGPKSRSVFADAPALVLEAAGLPGVHELGGGLAAPDVFLGVEPRHVLADDLLGSIPFDPLGAGVPARHATLGIEHEERAVGHAGHEQAEALLALVQFLCVRPLALGDVFRHDQPRAAAAKAHGVRRDENIDDPAVLPTVSPLSGLVSSPELLAGEEVQLVRDVV